MALVNIEIRKWKGRKLRNREAGKSGETEYDTERKRERERERVRRR